MLTTESSGLFRLAKTKGGDMVSKPGSGTISLAEMKENDRKEREEIDRKLALRNAQNEKIEQKRLDAIEQKKQRLVKILKCDRKDVEELISIIRSYDL
jgi:hypothetical protein